MEEQLITHAALCVPENLAHIFSFLDGTSQKAARQVSRDWNLLVLDKFHKKLCLRLGSNVTENEVMLNTVKEKMLTSLAVSFLTIDGNKGDEMFQRTFRHRRLYLKLTELRVLKMDCIQDVGIMYSFIQLTNSDGLPKLETLELRLSLKGKQTGKQGVILAAPGTLPDLKNLLIQCNESCSLAKFKSGSLPAVMQSLLAAAANLENLESNMFLDLAGCQVKKLKISKSQVFEGNEELGRMLSSTSESLKSLELYRLYPDFRILPQFPKVSALYQHYDKYYYSILRPANSLFPVADFPALKRMNLPFIWCNWKKFALAGEMEEIILWSVPFPHTDRSDHVESLRLLLNADVARLELNLYTYYWDFEGLRRLLQEQIIHLNLSDSANRVLEINGLKVNNGSQHSKEYQLQYFTDILDKLSKRWDRVEFFEFKFTEDPTWTEAELLLSHGRKKCFINIKKIPGRVRDETRWDVLCKICHAQ